MTTISLHPVSTHASVEVVCGICAQTVPAIGADGAGLLLRLVDLILQLRGARVDELELRELSVEDAHDLGKLFCVSRSMMKG